ncbi:MAG: zinc metallopeptidase [Clostridiales bacterium]|nr:zinc metallopeptidase [Clostridiales bacterium]
MFFYGSSLGFIILLPLIAYAMYAQSMVTKTFNRYLKVPNTRGITGAETARKILDAHGLNDVKIVKIAGKLSDHYDPRSRTVSLSEAVYSGNSIASVSVGAHEVGHAIQHAEGYAPLNFRSLLAPVASFGSKYMMILVFAGFIFNILQLIDLGILFYALALLFQIVTLPVEFNASTRAIANLTDLGIVYDQEIIGSKTVLKAAAMTYVAAAAVSAGQLFRLILIRNSRR